MPNVILITIDALRNDHFNKDLFPEFFNNHLSDFAVFDNCLSNGTATPLAFPAIHTGLPVEANGVLPQNAPTIAELASGRCKAISNNPHLNVQRGYSRGFDEFNIHKKRRYDKLKWRLGKLPLTQRLYDSFWNKMSNRKVVESFTPLVHHDAQIVLNDLFESIEGQNGFYWTHLLEPHAPYTPRKIGQYVETDWNMQQITNANRKIVNRSRKNMGLNKNPNQSELEEIQNEDIVICREMYAHMINYVDLKLSNFIARLKTRSDYNDNIIIILSDHGEAFGEGGVFTHDWTANPIDVLLKVPLIIKYPQNQITGTFDHLVQSADIFTTLTQLLGWDVKPPDRTRQLTDDQDRVVVSKSNTAVRITTSDGVAIRRGEDTIELQGDLPRTCIDLLHSQKIPNVASLDGVIPKGGDDDILQQLEYLGYI